LKLRRGRSGLNVAARHGNVSCACTQQQEQRLGSKSNFSAGLRGTGGDGLFFLYLFSNNNVRRARRCVGGLAQRLRRAHDNTGGGDDALTSAEDAGRCGGQHRRGGCGSLSRRQGV